jgi:hypothetical protein
MNVQQQRSGALIRANEVRLVRMARKRWVHALPKNEGLLALADLIEAPPEWFQRVMLRDALTWPKRTGRVFVSKALICLDGGADEVTYIGGDYSNNRGKTLSDRQRRLLAAWLRRKAR